HQGEPNEVPPRAAARAPPYFQSRAVRGAFGMAVFELDSFDSVCAPLKPDPANAVGHYAITQMASAVARPR
ncbi:MAG: hypothetical protein ABIQ16_26790, partial [Polyangiaceae bacterium]